MTTTTMPAIERAGMTRLQPGRIALGVAIAGVAAVLMWLAASAHLRYMCVVRDTPYLPLCADPATQGEELRTDLRERLQRNPGDAWAWSSMVPAATEETRDGILHAATELAPNNATVLRWRAATALEQERLKEGVALLVQLLQHRGTKEAARILAQVATLPDAHVLLQPHLKDAPHWLPRVIASIHEQNLSPGDALPLVVEAARQDVLPIPTRRLYMQLLRANGQWLDAYALWLALHKREVPTLYNGSFDQQFVADGFDWEFTFVTRSRAGVIIEQQPVARRGQVLSLDFTGRRFALPIVRQFVFLSPGNYRLEGQYMASKLRSEGGLSWTLFCPATKAFVQGGASVMRDSGGLWRPMEFDFKVPADCGPIASLQLEPFHKYEATAGLKGHVELDGFTLTRVQE